MKLFFLTLSTLVVMTFSQNCSPNICDVARIDCDPSYFYPCDGIVLPKGSGYCGCCPMCASYRDPIKCDLDHCSKGPAYLCADPNPCDGVLTKEGGPSCSCCEVCLEYKDEGASCGQWNPCRPALNCTDGKCLKHKM